MKKLLCLLVIIGTVYPQSKNATLTLYRDGYGLVKQPILFNLKKGRGKVSYSSIPDQLETNSPFLSLANTDVLYQRYNYDLFSTRDFLKNRLGQEIEVTPYREKSVKGILLDIEGNFISISDKENIRIFNIEQVSQLRVDKVKAPSRLKPILVWEINSRGDGKTYGNLIYLSQGFSWRTGYRLIVSTDENMASLITEAVMKNKTNLNYENAKIQLVEGNLRRALRFGPVPKGGASRGGAAIAPMMLESADDSPRFNQEEISDYKIYSLSESLTFPGKESITASLYSEKEIEISRLYKFENNERSSREEPLTVQFSFLNDEENNLGIPLPGGTVQIYHLRANKSVEFTGEDRINQVPTGEEAKIIAGKAFDVLGKRTVVNYDRKRKSEESTITLEIKNKRKDEISVQLIEHIYGDWVIMDPSHNYIKKDVQTIQFDLKIASDSTEIVSYTYRKEWK